MPDHPNNEQLDRGRFEGEVLARLDSLGQKIDQINATAVIAAKTASDAAALAASAAATTSDHEARLRLIEKRNENEKGKNSAISAAIAAAISIGGIVVSWLGSK